MSAERGTGPGGLYQPTPGAEGQLLLGGVPGNRRGGGDGTGEQQVTTTAPHPDAGVATSTAFLRQLRARHAEPLTVIWDNSPAHCGDALRAYLTKPGLRLCLVNPVSSTGQALPSYSPDFNADEAVWGWVRQEVTANLCLGTRAKVQEKVGNFFIQLAGRKAEVKQRCRTVLQTRAEGMLRKAQADSALHATTLGCTMRHLADVPRPTDHVGKGSATGT